MADSIIKCDGYQTVHKFPNGYGASVVSGPLTYGGDEGLFELAVLKFAGDGYNITYETPITSDVEGWLTEADVAAMLAAIAELPGVDG
jgi:hypothetical protein